ncbi:unnamed protein product [Rhodiola kirilowii]
MKAVVLALAATAFIFLVYLKVDHQLRPDPATTRRHALSRRFGFNSHHVVFDPLVANMERRAEQGGKTGGNDKTNGLASEVKGAYDYFDDEGNLNITLRIIVLFPWLDTSPKDGYVDFKELESWNTRMAMERLNYRTQREIEARDKDGDGNIGFREYLHHMTDQEIEKNGTRHGETGWWREQFENADVDRNGTLDFAEFKERMDYDEDGRLTYSEFLERAYDTYKNYIDFESAGAHVPSPETIFAQLDVVKDGFLSVEELMPILRYLHPGELAYAKYFTSYLFHELTPRPKSDVKTAKRGQQETMRLHNNVMRTHRLDQSHEKVMRSHERLQSSHGFDQSHEKVMRSHESLPSSHELDQSHENLMRSHASSPSSHDQLLRIHALAWSIHALA